MIITYMYNRGKNYDDYFPIFMMGNSLEQFLMNRLNSERTLMTSTTMYRNTNQKLRLTRNPQNTYIFDELTSGEVNDYIQDGSFFFR